MVGRLRARTCVPIMPLQTQWPYMFSVVPIVYWNWFALEKGVWQRSAYDTNVTYLSLKCITGADRIADCNSCHFGAHARTVLFKRRVGEAALARANNTVVDREALRVLENGTHALACIYTYVYVQYYHAACLRRHI